MASVNEEPFYIAANQRQTIFTDTGEIVWSRLRHVDLSLSSLNSACKTEHQRPVLVNNQRVIRVQQQTMHVLQHCKNECIANHHCVDVLQEGLKQQRELPDLILQGSGILVHSHEEDDEGLCLRDELHCDLLFA
jgi:hypothetical protein